MRTVPIQPSPLPLSIHILTLLSLSLPPPSLSLYSPSSRPHLSTAHLFRVIQKRLLTRFKEKNATPFGGMDGLMSDTYKQLLALGKHSFHLFHHHCPRHLISTNIAMIVILT